ncbi:MAG: family 10 glycosylhydrolase [Cytophagales bacterium]|nr:family 10 glycosylhydrolase [Bernardetiaceae bacterium]MDW8205479.1 family 10 glycosylhydrolase [Cytophagales bacterium]
MSLTTTLKFFLTYIALLYFHYPLARAQHAPKREFRAVWIATVANIDWPSLKGLPTVQQQKEFTDLLDFHRRIGLNAVIVQVRPATDAFYFSAQEMWSEWLTGKQGIMPEPYYDPLQFMIEETHRRGMEFHAWINPYRAQFEGDSLRVHPQHITRRKPEWFVSYGKSKIFNPGIPEVRQYITDIVTDIVRRYDVDGIHFDDYFYPYQIQGQVFNDSVAYKQYGKNFNKIEDWRRDNVNRLIENIALQIRQIKPYVKFGISPFGVWRNRTQDPRGSATQGGQTCYDHLYADIRLWLEKGWIDYVAPQIYFSIEFDKVPYKTLVDWWVDNSFGRHVYVGHGAYRVAPEGNDPHWAHPAQLPRQIRYNRSKNGKIHGSIYFSSKSLLRNPNGIADSLHTIFYRHLALPPLMAWKKGSPPLPPTALEVLPSKKGALLSWTPPDNTTLKENAVKYYAIYRIKADETFDLENPAQLIAVTGTEPFFIDTSLPADGEYRYAVTALSRLYHESKAVYSAPIKLKAPGSWTDFIQLLLKMYQRNLLVQYDTLKQP